MHLTPTAQYHRVGIFDVDGNSPHAAGGMQSVGQMNHGIVRVECNEIPAASYRAQTKNERPKSPLRGGRYRSDGLAGLARPDHFLR